MKHTRFFHSITIAAIVLTIVMNFGGAKAQSVHNEQYIALQNYLAPSFAVTFGASSLLATNYTFLLPSSAPTALDQTLKVITIDPINSVYTLGWGSAANITCWTLTGNSGTTSLINFIGTTDANDFVTKTNNIERMRVTSAGKVVVGTNVNPGQLQLQGLLGYNTFATGATQSVGVNYTLPLTAPSVNGQILSSTTGGAMSWTSLTGGTVTSVGLALPTTEFTISNSPVTTSGTLTGAWKTQNAAIVFAGPVSGAAAVPTFRALSATDIPSLSGSYIVNGTSLQTGNFNISGNGGIGGKLQFQGTSTGITTFQAGAQGATNINYTLPITAPTSGQVLSSSNTGTLSWTNSSPSGVTSVGLAMPSIFTVTNSPVTSSGTLTASLNSQNAAIVFAGPISGAAAVPTFRALSATDIPSLSGSYIVNGTNLQTANYNISGNGTIDGQLQLKGTSTGITTFQSGAQGSTTINYTLPIAQGATGTVLQNNGSGVLSWVDQSSQIGAVTFAIKGSDETITNSTTLQNDNDLSFSIGANETWEVVVQLDPTTDGEDDDAPDMKVAVTIPSGTLHVYALGYGDDEEDIAGSWLTTSGTKGATNFVISDDDTAGPITLQGIIVGGSTSGTVHIQWAPATSTSKKATIQKNSYLKATRAK